MAMEDSEQEARLRHALDKLTKEFLRHPDVSLIDIGLKLDNGHSTDEVVLRIHVRKHEIPSRGWPFPKQIDGIPIIIMYSDYNPHFGKV
jgi:hypothetical protein